MLIYFFFLNYLNNQTKEIIKKGKKYPLVHQQSSQQNLTPPLSIPASAQVIRFIRKKIKPTKLHTKNTKKEIKRESWTWIERSKE